MNNDGLTLNQLAERNAVLVSEVEKLRAERDQLAAENVGLKVVFSQGEIPDEAVDAFSDTVAIDSDWDESGTWSYVENETEVIRAVLDALRPETPATDRIVAVIKADAIDEAAVELDRVDTVASTRVIGFKLREFSQQLREGADK